MTTVYYLWEHLVEYARMFVLAAMGWEEWWNANRQTEDAPFQAAA